jgi:hypothetical protein
VYVTCISVGEDQITTRCFPGSQSNRLRGALDSSVLLFPTTSEQIGTLLSVVVVCISRLAGLWRSYTCHYLRLLEEDSEGGVDLVSIDICESQVYRCAVPRSHSLYSAKSLPVLSIF